MFPLSHKGLSKCFNVLTVAVGETNGLAHSNLTRFIKENIAFSMYDDCIVGIGSVSINNPQSLIYSNIQQAYLDVA